MSSTITLVYGYKGKIPPKWCKCFHLSYISCHLFRQCLCIYKDQKVNERFSLAIQGVVSLCVRVLKNIRTCFKSNHAKDSNNQQDGQASSSGDKKEPWITEELERLLQFVAKVFMLQFPLYAGPKSAGLRNEEVSAAEATQMAVYCDVHDSTGKMIFMIYPKSYLR